MRDFAAAMRAARLRKGISAAALGRRAGLSPNTIWAWERGERIPNLYTIEACADVLGISIDEYIGRTVPEDD